MEDYLSSVNRTSSARDADAYESRPRRYYLRSLRMDAFGGFRDREEGPFTPGLNVVWGANESGKTSMAKFIGGVLFGWEDARKSKNTYRPKGGSQSGSLVFSSLDNPRETVVCSRARNADGMVQSEPMEIVGDMDKDAYSTIFSLDSDELRGLNDAEAVIDKLLTAGSGTDASPAQAMVQIDARMKACFSKAASKPDSIPNLKGSLAQAGKLIADAEAESDRLVQDDAEAHDLEACIPALQQDIACSNKRMEALASARDALMRLDDREVGLRREAGVRRGEASGYAVDVDAVAAQAGSGHTADVHAANGRAADACSHEAAGCPGRDSLFFKAALGGFVALCLVGVVLLVFACMRVQLVFAVGAAAAFLAAACLALSAIFLFRNGDPAWDAGYYPFWDSTQQGASRGSSRDSCEEPAAPQQAAPQQASSQQTATPQAPSQQAVASAQLRQIAQERAAICGEWGVDVHDAVRQVGLLMQRESQDRESLHQQLTAANHRAGELRQILASARGSSTLESLRIREQMLQARLQEAYRGFAKLAIARNALASALEAWECSSQPRVYEQAGRLMSIMTNGAWQGVRPASSGVEVIDCAGISRNARELSLGTCQQLYLALRIALLMVAGNAGANLPVIADDILVHFDDERREAAVLALLELARHRQVILLTCHSGVVELVRKASADVNVLSL